MPIKNVRDFARYGKLLSESNKYHDPAKIYKEVKEIKEFVQRFKEIVSQIK
jgi:hypothetical protein